MAHEFGHVIQYIYNLNANGAWSGKWQELHADFLAGWYMGKMHYLETSEVRQISTSFWEKGDNEYSSALHHVTPTERAVAFVKGFMSSNMNLNEAYLNGAKFVLNINNITNGK